jgi:glycosyltransferase involved in cell wall biosynthesis
MLSAAHRGMARDLVCILLLVLRDSSARCLSPLKQSRIRILPRAARFAVARSNDKGFLANTSWPGIAHDRHSCQSTGWEASFSNESEITNQAHWRRWCVFSNDCSKTGAVHLSGTSGAQGQRAREADSMPRALPPVIVHSHLRWDFVWQRPQQIFSRLARDHRILFVEEPLLEGAEPLLRMSEPYPNVVRVVPVLPAAIEGVDAQYAAVLALLKQALLEHALLAGRFDAPVQWFYTPMPALSMAGAFGAVAIVYDCMDELANFRFAPPDIVERERFLLAKAHLVFTGGYELFCSKSPHHTNVHFFGCGVDVDHYSRARSPETKLPPDITELARPILGYFGVIDERLDYDLLARLAEAFPGAALAIIGPLAKVDRAMLPAHENIHWLGQRPYEELPAYLKAFDVCLMPFALNDATRYINPTKTLEYLAAGKPVVSTAVPDVVHHFTPVVEVARSADDFIQVVKRALDNPDPRRIQDGIEHANRASWESVVGAMRRHMLEAVSAAAQHAKPGNSP